MIRPDLTQRNQNISEEFTQNNIRKLVQAICKEVDKQMASTMWEQLANLYKKEHENIYNKLKQQFLTQRGLDADAWDDEDTYATIIECDATERISKLMFVFFNIMADESAETAEAVFEFLTSNWVLQDQPCTCWPGCCDEECMDMLLCVMFRNDELQKIINDNGYKMFERIFNNLRSSKFKTLFRNICESYLEWTMPAMLYDCH